VIRSLNVFEWAAIVVVAVAFLLTILGYDLAVVVWASIFAVVLSVLGGRR
jgi:hypothetical protein